MVRKRKKRKIVDTIFQNKIFYIKYENKISPLAKIILQSYKFKPYYSLLEDLLYLIKDNPDERDQLLQILHSTGIFLQNNRYVNFFNVYIYEITINEVSKLNKFINQDFQSINYITIKLVYQVKPITMKLETTW